MPGIEYIGRHANNLEVILKRLRASYFQSTKAREPAAIATPCGKRKPLLLRTSS